MEIIDEDQFMKQCPRFKDCSAPICPLDPLEDLRKTMPGDDKCGIAKSIRTRIAKGTMLPRQGMTKQEFAAWQHYQLMDDQKKKALANRGKDAIEQYRKNVDLL